MTHDALVGLLGETLDALNEASDAHLRRGDVAANSRAMALAIRLRTAADALERAGEDTKRLDWLEARARRDESVEVGWCPAGFEPGEYGVNLSSWSGGYYAIACDADGLYDHPTLRAAIDAARAAGGTNG